MIPIIRMYKRIGKRDFIVKNHALYSREEPGVMYEVLDIPEDYTIEDGTTDVFSLSLKR